MNNNLKIAIADNSNKLQQLLLESLKRHDNIEITHVSSDGYLCIEGLKESKPDILIMDILLPKVAGFEVLDFIKENSNFKNLTIIIMTALTNDRTIKRIIDYDVKYIINKPFDIDKLISTSINLHRDKLSEKSELIKQDVIYDKMYGVISKLLIDLGIKPSLSGFDYLKTAILKVYNEAELLNAVTKELYPVVAEIYQTEATNVERSMRHAIGLAWGNKANIKSAIKDYGYTNKLIKRPPNKKFISVICDYLRSIDFQSNSPDKN